MCVCVCVYVYMCVHKYAYIYIYVCIYVCQCEDLSCSIIVFDLVSCIARSVDCGGKEQTHSEGVG